MNIQRITVKRIWAKFKWGILAVLWAASFLLGYWGFERYAFANQFDQSSTEILYRTLQLISMNSGAVDGVNNWMLEAARFALPGLTAITALEALATIFREQTVWLRLWRKKGHIVVCGLGRKGRFLVDDLLASGYQVVVIEQQVTPVIVEEYQRRGAIILEGDATDPEMLENARINRAKTLICLLGDDSQNLQVAFLAAHLIRREPQDKLTCLVHFVSRDLMEVVRASEQSLAAESNVVLEVFNTYDRAAQQLIQEDSILADESNSKPMSFLVCGLGGFGKGLIRQMAYTLYRRKFTGKVNMIVLDQEADARLAELRAHCPKVDTIFQFQPVNIDLSCNSDLRSQLTTLLKRKKLEEVFICLGNPVLSVQVFLVIRQILLNKDIPIRTRIEQGSGMTYLLENHQDGHFFDIYQQTCTHELVIGGTHELLARQLREYYLKGLDTADAKRQLATPWEKIEEDEKQANRAQASRIYRILSENGYQVSPLLDWDAADREFDPQDVELMAKMEHQLWCDWKRDQGWQHGEVQDSGQKTNPDLIPWEDLLPEEREKNRHFIRCLPELLAEIGIQIDK